MHTKIPKRLYKYRAFNADTLKMIQRSEAYYADPTKFNDPLDTKPIIEIDTDQNALKKLLEKWIIQASKNDAFSTLNARKFISDLQYHSNDYENMNCDTQIQAFSLLLKKKLEDLLYKELSKYGVFSLSKKWKSPLMWSHYGDQHQGLCIEYDMTDHDFVNIQPVAYDKTRSIKSSDLYKWKIDKSQTAKQAILKTSFFTKAPEWRYECEWRDVNEGCGASISAKAKISSIYFGLRCNDAVKTAIVMLYSKTENNSIKFYEIFSSPHNFNLKSRLVDVDEIQHFAIQPPDYEILRSFSALANDEVNP